MIKFLSREFSRKLAAKTRFIEEARSAAKLKHPSLCTVHEVDERDGCLFVVTEYIVGESLKERIADGRIELKEALNIVIQMAEGLKEAHEKGVIHGDLSPAKIILIRKGRIKVVDFGSALFSLNFDCTKKAAILDTVAYVSPELASQENVDHRTDIWSVGCILYEMLTGRQPFGRTHDQDVIPSILHEEPEPVAQLRNHLPLGFEMVLYACLRKEPRNRYRNMEALLSDLKSLDLDDKSQIISPSYGKKGTIF